MANIIHPSAEIPPTVKFGRGVFVGALTFLQNRVSLGDFTQIREQCHICHDTKILEDVIVQPMVYIGSNITVNNHSFIGIKSCLYGSNLIVGNNCLVHPNITVMRNLEDDEIAMVTGKVTKRIYESKNII